MELQEKAELCTRTGDGKSKHRNKDKDKSTQNIMDQRTRMFIISAVIVGKHTRVSVASLFQELHPKKVVVILLRSG